MRWAIDEVDDRLGSERHTRPNVHDRLDDLEQWSRQTLQLLGARSIDSGDEPVGRVEDLEPHAAAFLNWAAGPTGYAAQAGVWFNPPVPVEHGAGAVGLLLVNERVVEQPFVFAAISGLQAPARILDVGGSESTVALSLASMGHDVLVVDPRGYPARHPGLRVLPQRLDELDKDERDFDAVLALSSVEHFGIGSYGQPSAEERLDLAGVQEMRLRTRPGGLLVLTVPLGEPAVDDFQRVYDVGGVRELLAAWEEIELSAAWRIDRLTWVRGSPDRPQGDAGVAMALARAPRRDA